jgi:lysophospholipase L1-like esterase
MECTISVIVSFVIFVIIAEFGFRSWFRNKGDYVWSPFEKTEMHLDKEVFPNMPTPVRFEINRDGERGAAPPRNLESTWRVLVVGGSAPECFFLDQSSSWPEVLADGLKEPKFLNKVGCSSIHVGNVGKSGLNVAGVNLVLDRILPRYKSLDCIIFMVGAGDAINWLADGAPLALSMEEMCPDKIFAVRGGRDFKWSIKKCAITEIIRLYSRKFTRIIRKDVGRKLQEVRRMRLEARVLIDDLPDYSGMLLNFEIFFRNAISRAQLKARYVVILRQPWFDKDIFSSEEEKLVWHAPKGRPHTQYVDTYYTFSVFNKLMRAVDAKVVDVCKEEGLPLLNLKAILPNSTVTYYDQAHFCPEGAKVVGNSVAIFLKNIINSSETP